MSKVLKITVKERDFARISEDVEATTWRIQETILVGELAATYRLGQMRRLLMHEKHKARKREFGFGRIETTTEMDDKRSRTSTSPVPDPFFYRNMVIPRRPHTPDECTLEMKVDDEGLLMLIILSQPASSQCDPSPRRAAVDTGSEEPGNPRRSPAIGTGSGPGASRAETQVEEERFPVETSMDGFLRSNCTRTEQEYILLHQPDIGVDDEKQTTLLLHNKPLFARSSRVLRSDGSKGRQLGLPSRTSSLIGAGHIGIITFLEKRICACRVYCFACFSLMFCLLSIVYVPRFVHKLPKQVRKAI